MAEKVKGDDAGTELDERTQIDSEAAITLDPALLAQLSSVDSENFIARARAYKALLEHTMAQENLSLSRATRVLARTLPPELRYSHQGILNILYSLEVLEACPVAKKLFTEGKLMYQPLLEIRKGMAEYGMTPLEILTKAVELREEPSDGFGNGSLRPIETLSKKFKEDQIRDAVEDLAIGKNPRVREKKEKEPDPEDLKNGPAVEKAVGLVRASIVRLLGAIKILEENAEAREAAIKELVVETMRETRERIEKILNEISKAYPDFMNGKSIEEGHALVARLSDFIEDVKARKAQAGGKISGTTKAIIEAKGIKLMEFYSWLWAAEIVEEYPIVERLVKMGKLSHKALVTIRHICSKCETTPEKVLAVVLRNRAVKAKQSPKPRYGVEDLIDADRFQYTEREIKEAEESVNAFKDTILSEQKPETYQPEKGANFAKYGVSELQAAMRTETYSRSIVVTLEQLRELLLSASRTIHDKQFPTACEGEKPLFKNYIDAHSEILRNQNASAATVLNRLAEVTDLEHGFVFLSDAEFMEVSRDDLQNALNVAGIVLVEQVFLKKNILGGKNPYLKQACYRLKWGKASDATRNPIQKRRASLQPKRVAVTEAESISSPDSPAESPDIPPLPASSSDSQAPASSPAPQPPTTPPPAPRPVSPTPPPTLSPSLSPAPSPTLPPPTPSPAPPAAPPPPKLSRASINPMDKEWRGKERREIYADNFEYELPRHPRLQGERLRKITPHHRAHRDIMYEPSREVAVIKSSAAELREPEVFFVEMRDFVVAGIAPMSRKKTQETIPPPDAEKYRDKGIYAVIVESIPYKALRNYEIRIIASGHPRFHDVWRMRPGEVAIVLLEKDGKEVGYGTISERALHFVQNAEYQSTLSPDKPVSADDLPLFAPQQATSPAKVGPRQAYTVTYEPQGRSGHEQVVARPIVPTPPVEPPPRPAQSPVQPLPRPAPPPQNRPSDNRSSQHQSQRPSYSPHQNHHGFHHPDDRRASNHDRHEKHEAPKSLEGIFRTTQEIRLEDENRIIPAGTAVEVIPKGSDMYQVWLAESLLPGIGKKNTLVFCIAGDDKKPFIIERRYLGDIGGK